uniref:Uncharacterized protein n=1 Tax=Schizaphis graminum TaxID=13262 RepID=A0A2S2NLP5_SCHGA
MTILFARITVETFLFQRSGADGETVGSDALAENQGRITRTRGVTEFRLVVDLRGVDDFTPPWLPGSHVLVHRRYSAANNNNQITILFRSGARTYNYTATLRLIIL